MTLRRETVAKFHLTKARILSREEDHIWTFSQLARHLRDLVAILILLLQATETRSVFLITTP